MTEPSLGRWLSRRSAAQHLAFYKPSSRPAESAILDIERDQFGPAERARESERDQRPVAGANQPRIGGPRLPGADVNARGQPDKIIEVSDNRSTDSHVLKSRRG